MEMKEDYLEGGKFSCCNQFMIQLYQVPNSVWNSLFRKSNGSDPENDESRSSKMVHTSAITAHLIDNVI